MKKIENVEILNQFIGQLAELEELRRIIAFGCMAVGRGRLNYDKKDLPCICTKIYDSEKNKKGEIDWNKKKTHIHGCIELRSFVRKAQDKLGKNYINELISGNY